MVNVNGFFNAVAHVTGGAAAHGAQGIQALTHGAEALAARGGNFAQHYAPQLLNDAYTPLARVHYDNAIASVLPLFDHNIGLQSEQALRELTEQFAKAASENAAAIAPYYNAAIRAGYPDATAKQLSVLALQQRINGGAVNNMVAGGYANVLNTGAFSHVPQGVQIPGQSYNFTGQFQGTAGGSHILPGAGGQGAVGVDAYQQLLHQAQAEGGIVNAGGRIANNDLAAQLQQIRNYNQQQKMVAKMEKDVTLGTGNSAQTVKKHEAEVKRLAEQEALYKSYGYSQKKIDKLMKAEREASGLYAYDRAKLDEKYGKTPDGKEAILDIMKQLGLKKKEVRELLK